MLADLDGAVAERLAGLVVPGGDDPRGTADAIRAWLATYTLHAMKVGIIGLGYVGLPLAVAFAEAGHEVVGLDTDARKVERLARRPRATSRTCLGRAPRRRSATASRRPPTATRSRTATRC